MTIHNSKVIARDTPAKPEQAISMFRRGGTRVTVRDLFGTMPVRVKQRALEAERSGSAKEFDQLVLGITAILLFRFSQVNSVDIRELTSSKQVHLSTLNHTGIAYRQLRIAHRTQTLLNQASFLDGVRSKSFTDIEASGFGVNIRGTVCLIPCATKRLQFIALGVEPLLNEHGSNMLYEEVNRVFANSAFGVIEGENDDEAVDGQVKDRSIRVKDLKVRKGIDRWPIFALQITFKERPGNAVLDVDDLLDGRSSNLAVITDLLRALAYQWLKKHHFRPKAPFSLLQQVSAEDGNEKTPASTGTRASPSSTVGYNHQSAFDSWSRVKTGRPLSGNGMKPSQPSPAPSHERKKPLLDAMGKLLRKPFGDSLAPTPPNTSSSAAQDRETDNTDPPSTPEDDAIAWVDPITKSRCTVNSRTGFVIKTDSMMNRRVSLPPPSKKTKETKSEPAPWIKEMLSTWQNPAYAPVEPPIVRVPNPFEATSAQPGRRGACAHVKLGDAVEVSTVQLQERVSKVALRDARVIAQVDSKFILVKLTPEAKSAPSSDKHESSITDDRELLVLIDQHAADERCRVEELQKAYFTCSHGQPGLKIAATELLDKPILFEVNRQESLLLDRFKQHFEHWGIIYTARVDGPELRAPAQAKTKVQVNKLPPSILERCRLEPRVLIELMRKEIWKLRDETGRPVLSRHPDIASNEEGDNGWVRRFHGCPQGILDLIFSRACRSAIMFNDHLSIEQCRELVLRLSGCVFPFQCAHGRPSMAPLVDLRGWSGLGSVLPEERREGSLVERMRDWKESMGKIKMSFSVL